MSKSSTLKLNLMILAKLPQPDETWSASALAAHQVMSAHIEKLTNCEPMDAHCSCGGSWVERESFKRLQITDLPEIKPTVTEYRERCLSCERCGYETYASARLPLGESCFGPYLHTLHSRGRHPRCSPPHSPLVNSY